MRGFKSSVCLLLNESVVRAVTDACSEQVDVHNNLGDLWRAQGQLGRQEAQRCYQEALRLEPGYAPAWRGLGDVFRENGDHNNAVACYQVSRSCSPVLAS